jgi:hypothetical protein
MSESRQMKAGVPTFHLGVVVLKILKKILALMRKGPSPAQLQSTMSKEINHVPLL